MSFGSRLRQRRKEMGLKQSELGKLLGVTGSAIGNYENNFSSPKADILFKVFEVLHCDANFLFQDEIKNPSILTNTKVEELEPDECELLDDYHKLNENGKEAARNAVRGLTYAPNYQRLKESQNVEISEIASDAIRTIDKLTEATRKNQNDSLRKK